MVREGFTLAGTLHNIIVVVMHHTSFALDNICTPPFPFTRCFCVLRFVVSHVCPTSCALLHWSTSNLSLCQSDGQFKKTACNDLLKSKNPDFKFTPMQDGIKQVSAPSPINVREYLRKMNSTNSTTVCDVLSSCIYIFPTGVLCVAFFVCKCDTVQ